MVKTYLLFGVHKSDKWEEFMRKKVYRWEITGIMITTDL